MRKKYVLRENAKEAIKDIGRYTLKNHGKAQRNKYLQGMSDRFEALADMPLKGRARPEVKAGYYSYDYEKHTIFYLIHDAHIEIIGVVHESSIPQRYL